MVMTNNIRLPPIAIRRWVIKHDRNLVGVHLPKMKSGYDASCTTTHICLFKSIKEAQHLARLLVAHRNDVHDWPSMVLDDGINIENSMQFVKTYKPLSVSAVCPPIFCGRLNRRGLSTVEVRHPRVIQGRLYMDVETSATDVEEDMIRDMLNKAFR